MQRIVFTGLAVVLISVVQAGAAPQPIHREAAPDDPVQQSPGKGYGLEAGPLTVGPDASFDIVVNPHAPIKGSATLSPARF